MDRFISGARGARLSLVMTASAILLAGCGSTASYHLPQTTAAPRPAPKVASQVPASPSVRPAVRGPVNGTLTLWHVRAGLNVAALSCRSTAGIERDYRKLLTRHKDVLKSSYAEAQRRTRGNFDTAQTKLYNRFASRFMDKRSCQAAAEVARETGAMDSATLVAVAPSLLSRIGG